MLLSCALNFFIVHEGLLCRGQCQPGHENEGGMFITPRNKWVMINGLRVSRVCSFFFQFSTTSCQSIWFIYHLFCSSSLSEWFIELWRSACVSCRGGWRSFSVWAGNPNVRMFFFCFLAARRAFPINCKSSIKKNWRKTFSGVGVMKIRRECVIISKEEETIIICITRDGLKSIRLCSIIFYELDINYIDPWINIKEA